MMNATKTCRPGARRAALAAAAGVALCLTAARAAGAATYYFDADGANPGFGVANGGTYNWDDANWSNNDATGSTATVNWPAGNFPRFAAGAGISYTVNVASVESVAGIQQQSAGIAGPPIVPVVFTLSGAGGLDWPPACKG